MGAVALVVELALVLFVFTQQHELVLPALVVSERAYFEPDLDLDRADDLRSAQHRALGPLDPAQRLRYHGALGLDRELGRMIPAKHVPGAIRDGHRFSDKIMRQRKAI